VSLGTSADLRELEQGLHSVGTTAQNGLKIGTTVDGSGTKATPKLQRIRMSGCGAIGECCWVLRQSQIRDEDEAVAPQWLDEKSSNLGDG